MPDFAACPTTPPGRSGCSSKNPSFKETQLTANGCAYPHGLQTPTRSWRTTSPPSTHRVRSKNCSADVQTYLDVQNPGTTVADIERTTEHRSARPRHPPRNAALRSACRPPIACRNLEDTKRFKVRFHLYNGGTDFIDYTITLPELIGKRPVVQYVGATPADQSVIDSFGGIYDTPPNLVNVKPLLKLDSVAVATATNAIGWACRHSFDMQLIQPAGASKKSSR